MLLLEKLDSESGEDLRVYTEALVCAIYAEHSTLISRLLPFGQDGEWKTLLRIGAQIQFVGKTFCVIESFALRIYASVLSLVKDEMTSRHAIVLYQRSKTAEEIIQSDSLDAIVMAFLIRGREAKRLVAEEVLAALPSSQRLNMPHRWGPDLDAK